MSSISRRRSHRGRSTVVRDYFQRADGALGTGWTTGSNDPGAITIAASKLVGPGATGNGNAIRTGETYPSDHWSELQVVGVLPAGNWIGPAVRMDATGANCYMSIYFNQGGSYSLQLYKRIGGTFTQIDLQAYPSSTGPPGYVLNGPLNDGDTVRLSVAGSELSVWLNNKRVTRLTDTSILGSGGQHPGIVAFGASTALHWGSDVAGAKPTLSAIQVVATTPPNSVTNNGGPHNYRVLTPVASAMTPAARALPHNFLLMLPVSEDGQEIAQFGDSLGCLEGLNAHNEYNLTIISPGWNADTSGGPWITDNGAQHNYETHVVSDIVPWMKANYAISGTEGVWLIGFSRTGLGAMDLLFRHPTVFAKAAAWDWPYDMSVYTNYGGTYLSQAQFDANYRMSTNLASWAPPFQASKRIWVGGYQTFQADDTDVHTGFNTNGILHDWDPQILRAHTWWSGWVPNALASLAAMP